ncbi:MAG TPA: hypothetical protein ENK67_03775 [Flavobacteriia bacterium]|nr:hypothetical protein [Flavobacteriia bacterium]
MPKETPLNQEHLAHQINAFQIFLSEDTNKKLKIKFVMVQNSAEIDDFLNKIKKENIILITSMSFVFNETLALLLSKNGNTKKINRKIKLIGTLGSESKEHKKAYHPNNIIRIFPPDSDEAKIAYEFFYHKVLSFFCHNLACPQSSMGKVNNATVTVLHSESYGAALSKKFSDYFYNNDSRSDNEINPFGEQDANNLMNLRMYDFDEQKIVLDNNSSFHFIFIVGYEPNISKMLEMIFKEINDKNIDIEKVCFLFSPTVSVPEWKCSICKTIADLKININYEKIFYLKSKLPAINYEFNQNKEEINSSNSLLDFYNYKLEKLPISENLTNKVEELDRKPNYINIFAYLALMVSEKVYNKSKKNLHTLKYESFNHVMKNKISNKPKIYYDGDSYGHFTVRNFECNNLEDSCKTKNNEVETVYKPSLTKKKKRKGKRK